MEKWLTDHLEPIVFGVVAAWFAFTRWLIMRLYGRHEARMAALERRQDDHERETKQVIARVFDKMDEHYRVIDGKIDDIRNYLMTRPRNEREGDK